MPIIVLFVCLGNICRSPMAEAVFQQMVNEAGLEDKILVDSVGTGGWHMGELAHPGTRAILQKQGILYNGRSRQITAQDMSNQQSYIIGMDKNNLSDVQRLFGAHPRLQRLLDFATNKQVQNVPDPYYTGDFNYAYELIQDGCQGLLAHIQQKENL